MALAEQQGRIALSARRPDELEETARLVEAAGGQALAVPTDVTDDEQIRALVAKVIAEWGAIDIVVANAGQYVRGPVIETSMDDVEQSIDVNFFGAARLVLTALPHLVERGSGHIVFLASVDGKKGLPLDAPYAASKFAMVGFADVMRQELRSHGINVSTILPGRVETAFVDGMRFPWIGRSISPERVARAVLRAIRRNRAEIILPPRAIPLVWSASLTPRLSDVALRVLKLEGWREEERP